MQRFIRFLEVALFFAMVPGLPVTVYLMYLGMEKLGF